MIDKTDKAGFPSNNWYFWFKWLSDEWYIYLLEKPLTVRKFLCRLKGHPEGQVWYSSGFEPDTSCKNCGDEI